MKPINLRLPSTNLVVLSLQEVSGWPEVRPWSLHNHSSFSKHRSISLIARANHTLNIGAPHSSPLPSAQLSVHWSAVSSYWSRHHCGPACLWTLKGRLLWVLCLTSISEGSELGQWMGVSHCQQWSGMLTDQSMKKLLNIYRLCSHSPSADVLNSRQCVVVLLLFFFFFQGVVVFKIMSTHFSTLVDLWTDICYINGKN